MSVFESINVVNGQQADLAAASGNPLRVAATYNSTPPVLTTGEANSLQLDVNANLKTVLENGVSSGTAGTPSANVLTIQPIGGTVYNNNVITAASPAVVIVRSAPAAMLDLIGLNFTSAAVFIHFYDTTATVTIGTTPPTFTLGIPGNLAGAGVAPPMKIPRAFVTGFQYAVTGGPGATDNTNIGTTGVIIDISLL